MKRSMALRGQEAFFTSGGCGLWMGWKDHQDFGSATFDFDFSSATTGPVRGSCAPVWIHSFSAAMSSSLSFCFGGIRRSRSA